MRPYWRRSLLLCLALPVASGAVACGGGQTAAGGDWAFDPADASHGAASSSGSSGGVPAEAGGGPGGPDAGPAASDGAVTSSGKKSKRGMAYGSTSNADMAAASAGIAWWYNWSPAPDKTLSSGYAASQGVEFVPMIWGGNFDPAKLATQVPAGAKYLLTFNEPNFGTQSNLTPAQAAALWPKVEAFAQSRGLEIVSPALNYCGGNCNETNPFAWLDAFFAACAGCRVDYIGAHWYACSKQALTGYLSEYETKYKKPLWLTEFACLDGSQAPTAANEDTYMQTALQVLEADPMVFRYSWFTGRFSQQPSIDLLGAASGSLTVLGQHYVALPGAQ
jgi:hypothetical protein